MSVYLTTAVISYLLGTIPFGYLLVRLFRGEDVRASGSGNIGATNVARTSSALGVATLILDAGKGFASVLLAHTLSAGLEQQKLVMTMAALCAVVGHLYPIWLKFRGGKGVATSFGSFALIAPKSVVCTVGLFLLIVAATRYVSMGSAAAAAAFPLLCWFLHDYSQRAQLIPISIASALILWKHRQNIGRWVAGTEPQVGAKRG